MTTRKKISLECFTERAEQVIRLVNTRKMEIIVYDSNGPVARLAPIAQKTTNKNLRLITPSRKPTTRTMDMGGVWKVPGQVERKPRARKPVSKLSQFLSHNLLKLARVSAVIPLVSKF